VLEREGGRECVHVCMTVSYSVCYIVLQCVAVCCSVLKCVAVCCSMGKTVERV